MYEILNSIIADYEKSCSMNDVFNSFLSVTGKTYNENLISRLVSYTLARNKDSIRNLIDRYIKNMPERCKPESSGCSFDTKDISEFDVNIVCEKLMGKDRADIFAEISDGDKTVATITIENKIWSEEHDNQTVSYYDWVTRNYIDCFNTFFFLRPGFNVKGALCRNYHNITYSDLLEIIVDSDYITHDFIKHIRRYLEDYTLNETQKKIIDNFSVINDAVNEARRQFRIRQFGIITETEGIFAEKQEVKDFRILDWGEVGNDNSIYREVVNFGVGIGSYRLYRNEWYCKNKYYFYVEIKFEEGKFDEICFQRTIKGYENSGNINEGIVPKFLKEYCPDCSKPETDQFFVIEKEKYSSDKSWDNESWGKDFSEKAAETLSDYIKKSDETFMKFKEFIENHNL